MTKEQQQVKEFMLAAGQECPRKPISNVDEKVARLRLALIGEELVELANSFGYEANFDFTDYTPNPEWSSRIGTADALGDLLVVVLGAAVACGIDLEPIFQEIHRSNMTKFIDGYKREDGKWIIGPSYSPANLQPIIEEQQQT